MTWTPKLYYFVSRGKNYYTRGGGAVEEEDVADALCDILPPFLLAMNLWGVCGLT